MLQITRSGSLAADSILVRVSRSKSGFLHHKAYNGSFSPALYPGTIALFATCEHWVDLVVVASLR